MTSASTGFWNGGSGKPGSGESSAGSSPSSSSGRFRLSGLTTARELSFSGPLEVAAVASCCAGLWAAGNAADRAATAGATAAPAPDTEEGCSPGASGGKRPTFLHACSRLAALLFIEGILSCVWTSITAFATPACAKVWAVIGTSNRASRAAPRIVGRLRIHLRMTSSPPCWMNSVRYGTGHLDDVKSFRRLSAASSDLFSFINWTRAAAETRGCSKPSGAVQLPFRGTAPEPRLPPAVVVPVGSSGVSASLPKLSFR
mmetsp:Transcript_28739/g.66728  ORF Transcript_28739/g.66728 Transcript_28739/m.66728 type:complete len:258 (-) Transcript_28739:556-1329(-)